MIISVLEFVFTEKHVKFSRACEREFSTFSKTRYNHFPKCFKLYSVCSYVFIMTVLLRFFLVMRHDCVEDEDTNKVKITDYYEP
jgi:hypothetical protein